MGDRRIETFLYDADGNRTDDEALAVRAETVELDADGNVVNTHAHEPSSSDSRAMFSASSGSGASTLSHASTIARAVSGSVRFSDMTKTFASFHFRAPSAIHGSHASAARTPGTLLAAIDVPVPVQQNSIP